MTETTVQMLSQRRTRTLQDLASRTSQSKTEREACELATAALGENQLDLPFVLIYLADGESGKLKLAASAQLSEDYLARMDAGWPFEEVVSAGTTFEVTGLIGL